MRIHGCILSSACIFTHMLFVNKLQMHLEIKYLVAATRSKSQVCSTAFGC
jgi:hypothetical protein